jgi:hypothetical protein
MKKKKKATERRRRRKRRKKDLEAKRRYLRKKQRTEVQLTVEHLLTCQRPWVPSPAQTGRKEGKEGKKEGEVLIPLKPQKFQLQEQNPHLTCSLLHLMDWVQCLNTSELKKYVLDLK